MAGAGESPLPPGAATAAAAAGAGAGAGAAEDRGAAPVVPWFDRVLADLGDGQSLAASLSTFSGHVRRLRLILAAATPESLVLLDEVGGWVGGWYCRHCLSTGAVP